MENAKKITVAEKYDMVVKALATVEGTDDLIAFIEDRKVKSQKKSTSKVDIAKAEENAKISNVIAEVLANGKYRNADLTKEVNARMGADYQPQKISNIVSSMKKNGTVVRVEEKGVALFTLA